MAKTNYEFLNDYIKDHLEEMIKSSIFVRKPDSEETLEIFIKMSASVTTTWNEHLNRTKICRRLRFDIPLIPQPDPYDPHQYAQYEEDLDDYIENYLVQHGHHGIYGHVFNLGTVAEPQMNLVLSKGPLRREHLGTWIQNWLDDEEVRGGAPPNPSPLEDNLEVGDVLIRPGSSKQNGPSAPAPKIDTYQFRKRLVKLTKNPTERKCIPSPGKHGSSSEEATVSSLSEDLSDSNENLPEVYKVKKEEADIVEPEGSDVIAVKKAKIKPDENAAASEGKSKPEGEIKSEETVEEGQQSSFAPGEEIKLDESNKAGGDDEDEGKEDGDDKTKTEVNCGGVDSD